MTKTVYIKLRAISQVHGRDVQVADIGEVYCSDRTVENRCRAVRVAKIHSNRPVRLVGSIVDLMERIGKAVPEAEITAGCRLDENWLCLSDLFFRSRLCHYDL